MNFILPPSSFILCVSISLTTDSSGALLSQNRYLPYGQERWSSGGAAVTDFGFTGQRADSYIKLLDYNARFYSPVLGRFISPDSIIPDPGGSQGFNRYAYVNNNPLRYVDPSGHCIPDVNCPGNNSSSSTPTPPTPSPTASPTPMPLMLTYPHNLAGLGGNHISQWPGHPTGCGPDVNTMFINLLMKREGSQGQVTLDNIESLMQGTGYTIPTWIPKAGGATFPPQNEADAFNYINGSGIAGKATATYAEGGTRATLLDNIKNDKYTGIFWSWDPALDNGNEGAHYVGVVGYDPNKDQVLILDPGQQYGAGTPPEGRVEAIDWTTFNRRWSDSRWGHQNAYISYTLP